MVCSQSTANHTSRISKNDFEVKREAISADTAPQLTGRQLDNSALGYRPPAPETVQWQPWPRDEKLLLARR